MGFVLYQNLQTSPLCLNIVKSILCHFEGMKGAKTSGVHDWQVFETLGEIHGQV